MTQNQKSRNTRLVTSLIVLILALISLIILRVHQNAFWIYTALMSVVVALICVGQGAYLSFKEKDNLRLTIWRQVLYWVGALGAVYIVALMLHYGITNSIQSGLFVLLILAIVLYLIGIADDLPFALVGITIALMVSGFIVIPDFLLVIIPVTVIMGIAIYLLIRRNKEP